MHGHSTLALLSLLAVFNAAAPKLRALSSRVVPNWYCSVVNMGKPISNKHLCTGGLINKGPCTVRCEIV